MPEKQSDFKPLCLSLDLEVGVKDNRIYEFAAIRGDNGASLVRGDQTIADGLNKLDTFAEGLKFLLGHNLIAFDLPHLAAANPNLDILTWPAVDTLPWMNRQKVQPPESGNPPCQRRPKNPLFFPLFFLSNH